nr:Ferrienterobactin-binding periplasmic protein precursor [Candidatus Pantoea persica]
MQAGDITMLTVRFGSILSSAIGRLVMEHGGAVWNYGLAAFGTLLNVLTLLRLSVMPPPQPREHPLRALASGVQFMFAAPLVGIAAVTGALVTLASAVHVLYPALAPHWQVSLDQLGLMYAAVPLGTALGSLTSRRLAQSPQPSRLILASAIAAFVALGLFSLMPWFAPGLVYLAAFGYFSAINSLVQYAMIQSLTPDALLGRINSQWTAQNVTGDAIGALGSCLLTQQAAAFFGFGAALLGMVMWILMARL